MESPNEAVAVQAPELFQIKNSMRSVHTRALRHNALGRTGTVQRLLGGDLILRRGVPQHVTRETLEGSLEDFRTAVLEGRIQVLTLDGREVDLATFSPRAAAPEPNVHPNFLDDDAKRDINPARPPQASLAVADNPSPEALGQRLPALLQGDPGAVEEAPAAPLVEVTTPPAMDITAAPEPAPVDAPRVEDAPVDVAPEPVEPPVDAPPAELEAAPAEPVTEPEAAPAVEASPEVVPSEPEAPPAPVEEEPVAVPAEAVEAPVEAAPAAPVEEPPVEAPAAAEPKAATSKKKGKAS